MSGTGYPDRLGRDGDDGGGVAHALWPRVHRGRRGFDTVEPVHLRCLALTTVAATSPVLWVVGFEEHFELNAVGVLER